MIGWVFFRSETISQSFNFLGKMFGFKAGVAGAFPIEHFLSTDVAFTLLVAGLLAFPSREELAAEWPREPRRRVYLETAMAAVLFILSASSLTKNSFNPFIYFRF